MLDVVIGAFGNVGIFLQAFNIYDVFFQWEQTGVFDLLLPFLLIFAVIFGILTSTGILGGHRGVNLVISLVIGLMALRFGFVSAFFSELFPRFAIGLSLLIVLTILVGLFIHPKSMKGWFIGLGILGAVIGVIVIAVTFNSFYWFDSFFWQQNYGLLIGGIILVVLIVSVFVTAKPRPEPVDWEVPLKGLRSMIGG